MSSLTIVYIVTGVLSVVVALLLVYLGGLSSQTKSRFEHSLPLGQVTPLSSDAPLTDQILGEIENLVGSKQQGKEISQRVSAVLDKELQKRVARQAQELAKQYETTIEQKEKSEEIAWEKYKKVMVDKKQTEAVIRSIADGLVVVDSDGNVIMMNPAAEKLLGVSKKDKIGKPITGGVKDEQLVSFAQGAADQEDKDIELSSGQSETKKIVRASTAVIENENGKTVGMVSVLSDVTKQRELDELKSKFVASVSHELRTPLVSVEKSISLMLAGKKEGGSEAERQLLMIAERNLKRLSLLVNDILDFSKLEAGKMEIKKETLSIEPVIVEMTETLTAWANTKQIKLEKNIDPGLPGVVIDALRIGQVLTNLISNAIKFTPAGGTVTTGAKLDSEKKNLLVSVRDTGIGISEKDLPKVFDKFYQTGERVSSDIAGTGLGLSITKEIVELHGGTIWVESKKDQGAMFTFSIPIG